MISRRFPLESPVGEVDDGLEDVVKREDWTFILLLIMAYGEPVGYALATGPIISEYDMLGQLEECGSSAILLSMRFTAMRFCSISPV